MEIKDTLRNNLKDEALANALDFVDFLTDKGLTPHMEWDNGVRFAKDDKSPCLVVFNMNNSGEWFVCDVPITSEPEWNSLNNDLKEFILANIKLCSVHQGSKCGCGSEPGVTKNIFGKDYNNVCTSEIQIHNPNSDELGKFKDIVEWWVVNIGA